MKSKNKPMLIKPQVNVARQPLPINNVFTAVAMD